MSARVHKAGSTPRPVRPFPSRCGDCHAPRVNGAWTDPTTFREFAATVRHDGTCRVYRERSYDRAEPVAHLLSLGGARR